MKHLLFIWLVLIPLQGAADEPAFNWPGGARAAVNLAYDDAIPTQLDNALPALDRHGFKGSFYVTLASEAMRDRMDEWRAAANNGHELGNHSLFHPCQKSKADREWVSANNDLDQITVAEMRNRIVLASTFLNLVDGREERTFTPPCLDSDAAGKLYWDDVKDLFIAIKGKAGDGVTDNMAELNPHRVEATFPVGATGDDLIAVAKHAAERGTMANFTFHGIGGDHAVVSIEAHEALLQHLADHPKIYWVDTFLNIMKYVENEKGLFAHP